MPQEQQQGQLFPSNVQAQLRVHEHGVEWSVRSFHLEERQWELVDSGNAWTWSGAAADLATSLAYLADTSGF